MMSSAKAEFCRLERPLELYENERLWIGRGFSKAGLLPAERGPFSTRDGSASWKTLPEAALALLRGDVKSTNKRVRRGWSFHEEGTFIQTPFIGESKENLQKEDEFECSAGENSGDDASSLGNYCHFVPCAGPAEQVTDSDGWQVRPSPVPQLTTRHASWLTLIGFIAVLPRFLGVLVVVPQQKEVFSPILP